MLCTFLEVPRKGKLYSAHLPLWIIRSHIMFTEQERSACHPGCPRSRLCLKANCLTTAVRRSYQKVGVFKRGNKGRSLCITRDRDGPVAAAAAPGESNKRMFSYLELGSLA